MPDPTCEAAERIAKRLGIPRGQLYARAIEAFVKTRRHVGVRESLAKVYGAAPARVDPALDQLQAEALREEW